MVFKPGMSGNPLGRPQGTRNKFSDSFLRDLAQSWQENGATILAKVAATDASRYLAVCASLVPRDVALTIESRLPGGLDPDGWRLMLSIAEAIREALPDASKRSPSEVLEFVKDAINSHSAKLIDARPAVSATEG